jgi:hypothetical protein
MVAGPADLQPPLLDEGRQLLGRRLSGIGRKVSRRIVRDDHEGLAYGDHRRGQSGGASRTYQRYRAVEQFALDAAAVAAGLPPEEQRDEVAAI